MNILVSCMGYDGGKSGISSYMRNVVGRLNGCGHDITLVLEYGDAPDFDALGNFKKIVAPKAFSKSARGFLWHMFALPFIAKNKKFDCLLVLAANRRFTAFGKIPQIGVVHDLSQYRVCEKYDALRMFYLTKIQPFLGRRLSAAAAISLSTKADIEKYWRMPVEKITLDYNGVAPLGESDDGVLKRLGLSKYIFYVSRIEHPGKNHVGLIEAFERLPENLRSQYKLVFAGAEWSGADAVKSRAAKSAAKDSIVFTGYVTNGELASLYRNASAFVFPSFSEGFGLPLVEAMSVGVPCACSDDSALAEIGADAALKFDPHSPEQISKAIERILTDSNLARELAQKGLERAKDFDWQKHADTLISICKNEYDKHSELSIFGVKFVNARMGEVVETLDACAQRGEKKTVAFINTHYLNTAYEDREQLARLNKFDFVLPDGSGVSMACKILGYRYRDNLNGTDLLPRLCALSEKKGYRMYFIGGKDGVARRAAENLKKMFPNVNIVGTRAGYFTPEENASVVAEINAARPDFLFAGFGVKLQEKWVLENIDSLECKIAFAIGGVCDVYSGDLFRVHPKLREWGLEWLGRLYQDPVRLFGRYVIGNPLFVLRVLRERLFGFR